MTATSHKQAQRVLDAIAAVVGQNAAEVLNLAAQAIPEWKIRSTRRIVGLDLEVDDLDPTLTRKIARYGPLEWRITGRRGAPRTGVTRIMREIGKDMHRIAERALFAAEMNFAAKPGNRCPRGGAHTFVDGRCICGLRREGSARTRLDWIPCSATASSTATV